MPHETSIETASISNSREQGQTAVYGLSEVDQLPFWARSAARLARADITNGPKVLKGSAHCMNVCYQVVSPRYPKHISSDYVKGDIHSEDHVRKPSSLVRP
jgi:hypothetical protein